MVKDVIQKKVKHIQMLKLMWLNLKIYMYEAYNGGINKDGTWL